MVYKWSVDKYPVSAQVAGEEIERIQTALNKEYVEPEDVLEASRNEDAPLHECFLWDNNEAAEKYRLGQAREIIKTIVVVVEQDDASKPTPVVRAFVSVAEHNDKGKFIPIQTAMVKEDYRKQVLQNALWELQNFKRKYTAYQELSDVFKSIDNFADSLK